MKNEDFSIVVGGPLYQLYLKSKLAQAPIGWVERRIFLFVAVTWLPLLVLSLFAPPASGAGVSFFTDIEVHARFLIALPLLIAAELIVHERTRMTVEQFNVRGIILPKDQNRYSDILKSVARLRGSILVELTFVVLIFTFGRWLWMNHLALHKNTWYATFGSEGLGLTVPGLWYSFVSVPIFQFLLVRWYFRFLLWAYFLWKVSRLDLRLMPAHPDRAGGISFLGTGTYAFGPILLAQGALMAGFLSNRIFFGGQTLISFKVDIVGMVLIIVSLVLAPLLVFIPVLTRAKRDGRTEYGALAHRYAQEFDEKWVHTKAPAKEPLIGTADIQSLADMGNSYMFVRQMRPIPFGPDVVIRLILVTILPVVPLLLTVIPLDELIDRLFKILI